LDLDHEHTNEHGILEGMSPDPGRPKINSTASRIRLGKMHQRTAAEKILLLLLS
jgi:hypothetical protein